MKKILLVSLLVATTSSFAQPLHHFDDVKDAVLNGKLINMVVDFSKCNSQDKSMLSMSAATFTPNEISVADNHIASSLVHFTMNNPQFLNKPVNEFVSYTISDDNTVTISHQVLAAGTYTLLEDKKTIICDINKGVAIYSYSK